MVRSRRQKICHALLATDSLLFMSKLQLQIKDDYIDEQANKRGLINFLMMMTCEQMPLLSSRIDTFRFDFDSIKQPQFSKIA